MMKSCSIVILFYICSHHFGNARKSQDARTQATPPGSIAKPDRWLKWLPCKFKHNAKERPTGASGKASCRIGQIRQ